MGGPSVDSLFPAIAQSFVIIIIGYVFGFFNLISPKESKTIGALIGNLFLPALLFKNLAILNLSAVSWPFLGGMLLAKFSVFLAVALSTMVLSRRVGTAGLFGIFVTQSNDFALGLPIVTAVYGDTSGMHNVFDYVSYIYLLAIVSLAIINPIGFVLMEYHKQSQNSKMMSGKRIILIPLRTLKGVVLNPIVFMTVLGLVVNVIVFYGVHKGEGSSSENLPDWLSGFLDVLGGAYAACALFSIGLFMVGKLTKITGTVLLVATLLIVAKTIFLPLIAYRVLYSLLPHGVYNSSQDSVSTFAFLLGTFPTAPTVFVYATQYSLAMEIVAASVVLCTFFSAPIMYLSARMILVVFTSFTDEDDVIRDCRRDVSIVTCISVAFVFVLFLIARRYRSYAHVFVMHLMVAMLIEVIGVDVLDLVIGRHLVYWEFFWFSLFFIGVIATRTWMASMSVGLLMLIIKGPEKAEKAWVPLMLLSWGIPILITVLLVAVCSVTQTVAHKELLDVSFLFGELQLILTLIVLIATFIIGFTCVIYIIVHSRQKNKRNTKRLLMENTSTTESHPVVQGEPNSSVNAVADSQLSHSIDTTETTRLKSEKSHSYGTTQLVNESLDQKRESFNAENNPLLQSSHRVSPEPESHGYNFSLPVQSSGLWHKDKSGQHLMRFVVLILFLLFSCSVGILIVIWKLSSPSGTRSGIFVAVDVLDTVTNFGQGFFVLAVFGFEKHWFWVALYQKLRRLFFKVEIIELPREEDIEVSVLDLCRTFKQHYKQLCITDIVANKKYFLRTYDDVFSGVDLVDWLVTHNVTKDRETAVEYGQSLMIGRVITHVINEHYFHDEPYFYRFCGSD